VLSSAMWSGGVRRGPTSATKAASSASRGPPSSARVACWTLNAHMQSLDPAEIGWLCVTL
jgi:hypothetical protein